MLFSNFITWLNTFERTELFKKMEETVEGSPWHREKNVAIHTLMVNEMYWSWVFSVPTTILVVDFILSNFEECDKKTTRFDIIGALACMFHDTGKPVAMTVKWSKERGSYKTFIGHEVVSARLWEDYAVKNWSLLKTLFNLEQEDIYRVGWMIEHHLPFQLRDKQKLEQFFKTITYCGLERTFLRVLSADQTGRLSDNHEEKIEAMDEWVKKHYINGVFSHQHIQNCSERVLYVPIAPSATGKTTYFKNNFDITKVLYYSNDNLRYEFYNSEVSWATDGNTYRKVFNASINDPDFNKKCWNRFLDLLSNNQSIYLDNVNLTRKSRRKHIIEAKQRGYRIVAILFPIALSQLLNRQGFRNDKYINKYVSYTHYMRLQLPQYGEVDEIITDPSNLSY